MTAQKNNVTCRRWNGDTERWEEVNSVSGPGEFVVQNSATGRCFRYSLDMQGIITEYWEVPEDDPIFETTATPQQHETPRTYTVTVTDRDGDQIDVIKNVDLMTAVGFYSIARETKSYTDCQIYDTTEEDN